MTRGYTPSMDITDIDGVGESLAATMREHGLGHLRDVARAHVDELAAVPGIGPVTAKRIRKNAKKLITPQVSYGLVPPRPATPEKAPKTREKKKISSKKAKKAEDKARKHEKKAAALKARMEKHLKKAAKARKKAR